MDPEDKGVFSFDAPAECSEEVLVCEPENGTHVVVRTTKHAPGVPLETLVDRLLREASKMAGFALVETSARTVGGRPALRPGAAPSAVGRRRGLVPAERSHAGYRRPNP